MTASNTGILVGQAAVNDLGAVFLKVFLAATFTRLYIEYRTRFGLQWHLLALLGERY